MYASKVDQAVADDVAAVAQRMAAAEREVHGEGEDHLHELSGIDTAVDLIAVAALMHHLAPERRRGVAAGSRRRRRAHRARRAPGARAGGGRAASRSARRTRRGRRRASGRRAHDADRRRPAAPTSPHGFGDCPAGAVVATGCGAGTRVLLDRPNVLRAMLVDAAGRSARPTSSRPATRVRRPTARRQRPGTDAGKGDRDGRGLPAEGADGRGSTSTCCSRPTSTT